MVKNNDPATPDDPGPATRPCNDCRTEIPESQARRTFEQYDVPLCQACATRREEEIRSGRITTAPTTAWHPSQVEYYEVFQTDPKRGRIYQVPDELPLPPGAIGQGFHRPRPGGACFQLFRMPGDAPVPGTLEYYEEEAHRVELASKATERPQVESEPQTQGNPSPEMSPASLDARTLAYMQVCEAAEDAIITVTLEFLEAIRAQTRAVTEAATTATLIMRNQALQASAAAREFFQALEQAGVPVLADRPPTRDQPQDQPETTPADQPETPPTA